MSDAKTAASAAPATATPSATASPVAAAASPAPAADSKVPATATAAPAGAASPLSPSGADREALQEAAAKAAWEAALAAISSAPTAAVAADDKTYTGQCLCGKVSVTCVGKPAFVGFCHCTICARIGGTDRALCAAWDKTKFGVKSGREQLKGYASTATVLRFFCRVCGSGVFNAPATPQAPFQFYGCSPALFGAAATEGSFRVPSELTPQNHVFYSSSCLHGTGIKSGSGLPLYKDVGKEIGGSGELVNE